MGNFFIRKESISTICSLFGEGALDFAMFVFNKVIILTFV